MTLDYQIPMPIEEFDKLTLKRIHRLIEIQTKRLEEKAKRMEEERKRAEREATRKRIMQK